LLSTKAFFLVTTILISSWYSTIIGIDSCTSQLDNLYHYCVACDEFSLSDLKSTSLKFFNYYIVIISIILKYLQIINLNNALLKKTYKYMVYKKLEKNNAFYIWQNNK